MNKLILLVLFTLGGCAHSVHQLHMGDFSGEKFTSGEWVSSQTSQKVILGFVFDTNYVNEARKNLIAKCPNGDIQGVTTRYSTSLGFFSWENKVFMQGLCLK
jgi:hypothetical protein